MRYMIQSTLPSGEKAMVSPAILRFESEFDAQEVCGRYIRVYPGLAHNVVRVDEQGYVVEVVS